MKTLWLTAFIISSLELTSNQISSSQPIVPIDKTAPRSYPEEGRFIALESEVRLKPQEPSSKANKSQIQQGTQLSLNGRTFPVAWSKWSQAGKSYIGISDTGLMQTFGVELLNTTNVARQPIQWFSRSRTTTEYLPAIARGPYRYLDITSLARAFGWQLKVNGSTLQISTPPAQVADIRPELQGSGTSDALTGLPQRIVVDLDRPTVWQVSHQTQEAVITIDAAAAPALLERFKPLPAQPPQPQLGVPSQPDDEAAIPQPPNQPSVAPTPQPPPLIVEGMGNKTTIKVKIPPGWRPKVSSLSTPSTRLVLDIAPDAMVERDILWAPGVRWRQKYLNLGTSRFATTWLEINLRQPGITFRPILGTPPSLVGIAPLVKSAPLWQAAAAINAGFFNRNSQLPLGAIRREGRWLSSPILNRGAIAWNDRGEIKMGRLSVEETLITQGGDRLPVLYLNSGYVQAGIARYTPSWGRTYTPLTDNEIVLVVQNNQLTRQIPGGASVGKTPIQIPLDGYLLSIRTNPELASVLAVGTKLSIESFTVPADFSRYPNILGAGPLLVENGQIVLDAKAEKFNDAFSKQTAVRSAIGTTASGTLIIAAVHNRAGGAGPTLTETAQLMQLMGAVDSLNLDGGSSTSLYLGGQLINRSPATAARVHNALGIFLQPPSQIDK
ncbi:phosphodiester glycosidase family protein [Microcoleus sp. FACHB-831]|uniref:phosphodiester glycosidase family protein n=1 Tax=Microcoleus sp. FACHB-831 TaxID=2692827 RepID=UPI0016889E74|nr:phosphodiester glycosidase family protein [Microcoleus sp. FACHB-831]MBD1922783.1 phosphodiester glycosidase family protein [Microcoleus sp. FACHB-831]